MTDPIFVFATNESGHHENEIAKLAVHAFGAEKSKGRGLVGRSYAIPVLDRDAQRLPQERILSEFAAFKKFARENPQHRFQLSRIGCDSIGFREEGVFKYFLDCPDNVILPAVWERRRNPKHAVFAAMGSTKFADEGIIHFCLDTMIDQVYGGADQFVEFITGDDDGVDFICAKYFASKGLPSRVLQANWERDGGRAGAVRNRLVGLAATHVLLMDDGECGKTAHMRKTAQAEGLTVTESTVSYTAQAEHKRVLDKPEVAQKVRSLSAGLAG